MYDLIVIGAGSGGLVAAKRAVHYGKRVLLCENDTIGGTCVSFGCVPKKLWHTIAHFKQCSDVAQDHGWSFDSLSFSWEDVHSKMSAYIASLNQRHEQKCLDSGVDICRGSASFVDAHTISINQKEYKAERILIAVGSKASTLDVPGTEFCDTSYEFFSWKTLPHSVAVIGGGYIAVELASILNALGVETHIVIRRDYVLRGFDEELRHFLQECYQKRGVSIYSGVYPLSFNKDDNGGVIVRLSDQRELGVEKVIQAVGRHPNTNQLNLETVGVSVSQSAAIRVNERYQSSIPSIYALGDCIDRHQLTPIAIAQARHWVDMMYTDSPFDVSFECVPTAIFSLPESASVGLTEMEAKDRYDTVSVRKLSFNPLTLALTEDHKEPVFMKVVMEGKDQRVVGIHVGGDSAAEIIQSLAVAVQKGITKKDLDLTMALHPTVTEELVTLY